MVGNIIVIAVLVLLVLVAVLSSRKHMKGAGGCCGGGSGTIAQKKELEEPQIGEKIIRIDGMHCENCKNSIERAINRIDGAACKVNLKKKIAVVAYSKEPDEEELRSAIERLDFTVVNISENVL